ncbi:class I SAM-dependent methyltransferase [Nocardia sp. NPDC052566]|uniref:class I SAM-dependent methyltransferase n=1 Tax=Nocardia sp. NPDC052566 TaxID=3364330 RepID=UPI0037CADAFD
MTTVQPRSSYGIDAPPVVVGLALGIVVNLLSALLVGIFLNTVAGWVVALFALPTIAQLALYLHSTRRGKFLVWAELLGNLGLRGDERLLDLGCGRGAVLIAAARRLPAGRAVGVDLWRSVDQSGNSEETTMRNAAAEGVADRVELRTGDMTALPFPDNDFDVVVSSLAIHNIKSADGRIAAVREAVRVLRPGGHLVIADIGRTHEYETTLATLGALSLARHRLDYRMWWGGPWLSTYAVTAIAPD